MTPTLKEMDNATFLEKLEPMFESLERQSEGSSFGEWAVSTLKDELRRRLMAKPEKTVSPASEPITVMVVLENRENMGKFFKQFQENVDWLEGVTPFSVCVSNVANGEGGVHCKGFFSREAVKNYLEGLRTAKTFGLNIAGIPEVP